MDLSFRAKVGENSGCGILLFRSVSEFRVQVGSDCSAMDQPNSRQSGSQRRLVQRGFWQQITPPQLFVASFALLILSGVLGFRLLPGLFHGERLGWVDSLFMATSAVCVTGLSVITTADRLTFAGELFLLLLVQLGALGILTFTSLIIAAFGRRLSLRQESLVIVRTESAPHLSPRELTRSIVRYTIISEFCGAVLLYAFWGPLLGWREAVWPSIFHAVSAFCNAGFSTFSDSLFDFRQEPSILLTISALIIAGGLGFLTHHELLRKFRAVRSRTAFRMSLQTRIVLVTTLLLLFAGWGLLTVLEWDSTLDELSLTDRLVNGLFMSVTARTAGFHSIHYGEAADSSVLVTMLLMSIGGSPGSTAGGLKTTTFALILMVAWSRLRGNEHTTAWYRTIPEQTASRAVGLFTAGIAVAFVGMLLLTISESAGGGSGASLRDCIFEAVSALNTVGLSTGMTQELSDTGRLITVLLMFLGRVGMLTLAAALTVRRLGGEGFRYANEDVVVG